MELDCWISANGKEIVFYDYLCVKRTKWRKTNYEKENARWNKEMGINTEQGSNHAR
jgi:hypothetical protein